MLPASPAPYRKSRCEQLVYQLAALTLVLSVAFLSIESNETFQQDIYQISESFEVSIHLDPDLNDDDKKAICSTGAILDEARIRFTGSEANNYHTNRHPSKKHIRAPPV